MDLPMSLILDLALGLVLLSILYTSWRRGFLASAIRLGGTVAGFLLASLVSRPAAAELYDRLVRDRVVEYVRGSLLAQGSALSQALEGTGQAGSALEAVAELLEEWGLDYFSSADAGAKAAAGSARPRHRAADKHRVLIRLFMCASFSPLAHLFCLR